MTGGAPLDGDGYFYAPTILTGVAEGTRIVDEEQFGPALPILPYRDLERGDRAGERDDLRPWQFGLVERPGTRARGRREARGRHDVDQHPRRYFGHVQPFIGRKWSGLGAENGHLQRRCVLRPAHDLQVACGSDDLRTELGELSSRATRYVGGRAEEMTLIRGLRRASWSP